MHVRFFLYLFAIVASLQISLFAGWQLPIQFAIVIPSYNNEKWCIKNIESCTSQAYPHWHLFFIDDHSTDRTADLVQSYIKQKKLEKKCTLIRNKTRKGALENIYTVASSCNPHHVVVTLDGDDWLAHPNVLDIVAGVYTNPNVWMTYGNFLSMPAGWNSCGEYIPAAVAQNNSFRSYKWVSTHLRTFYAKLFQKIKKADLMWNGRFFPMTWDMAFMIPMLEMSANDHYRFIPETLYIYNVANPINDHKVNAQLQRDLDTYIRRMPRYQPLNQLF